MRPVLVLAAALLAGSTACASAGGKKKTSQPVTSKQALIVRGMNGTTCSAQSIADGSSPRVTVNEDVNNLSASCSPDGKTSVAKLREPLPNAHACWATRKALAKQDKFILIITDPTDDNPYHCLINNITPKQMVKALNYRQ